MITTSEEKGTLSNEPYTRVYFGRLVANFLIPVKRLLGQEKALLFSNGPTTGDLRKRPALSKKIY